MVLHWVVLLWIPHVLVDLILELGVVLPLGGVLVDHWHVWVHHDLSVLLYGSDLRVQLLKVLCLLQVVLVQSIVDLVSRLQVLHVLFRLHVIVVGLVVLRVEVWKSAVQVLQIFVLFSSSIRARR